MSEQLSRVLLGPAQCAVDLGDGSERGPYVGQDYILRRMGRPHRAVNLMYCYFPLDREWPARISEVTRTADDTNAWGYAYDDYFPFHGEEPFRQMRDIRQHGQDVILTLTCDPAVSDEQIRGIARSLRPYGRLMLRLNHECTGTWFACNKRNTYQEVADFFVRFLGIMKETAPNVRMILCAGAVQAPGDTELEKEREFLEASLKTDIWSIDQYTALNWGWPAEVAEKDNRNHRAGPVKDSFAQVRRTFDRYLVLNGGEAKPMLVSEFNDDGDVLGPMAQCERVRQYYDLAETEGRGWLSGVTMYQFRDDGRLGLEATDPNDPSVGVAQPLLAVYRELIHRPAFLPAMTEAEEVSLPAPMRWGGAEDAEGVGLRLDLKGQPVFCEAVFEGPLKDMSLLLTLNGGWFMKKPGVTRVDLLPAFWERPLTGPRSLTLALFAPPPEGINPDDGTSDWDINYRAALPALPGLRIRYEGCLPMC